MDTHRNPAGGDGGASEGNHAAELIASEHTSATAPAQAHAYAFHPLAEIFPLIEGRDIKANGPHEPIRLLDDQILDGRNRYRACIAAGEEPVFVPYRGDDPAAYVVSMNVARRHLTQEQKRELIAKLLEANPDRSDRRIAATTKTDHKTVGKVRRAKEARGEIPHVETKTDTTGRQQPSKRAQSRTDRRQVRIEREKESVARCGNLGGAPVNERRPPALRAIEGGGSPSGRVISLATFLPWRKRALTAERHAARLLLLNKRLGL
jgi:hypothetical protein